MFTTHTPTRLKQQYNTPPMVSICGNRQRKRGAHKLLYVSAAAARVFRVTECELLYDPERDVCAIMPHERGTYRTRPHARADSFYIGATSFCRDYGLEIGDRYPAWVEEHFGGSVLVFGPITRGEQ